jgi:transketolase
MSQKIPILPATNSIAIEGLQHGAYILSKETQNILDAILIATGSEVALALEAKNHLEKEGYSIRLVSMPSFRLFDEQSDAYKEQVLPIGIKARVGVEMAVSFGWDQYIGDNGVMVSMDHFGASAPASDLYKNFGFNVDHIVTAVKTSMKRNRMA